MKPGPMTKAEFENFKQIMLEVDRNERNAMSRPVTVGIVLSPAQVEVLELACMPTDGRTH
jgi:hypothetical protein